MEALYEIALSERHPRDRFAMWRVVWVDLTTPPEDREVVDSLYMESVYRDHILPRADAICPGPEILNLP